MREAPSGGSGAYDDLIEAEREALARSGARVNKIALIRALREASGMGLREAKDAVEGYFARRDERTSGKAGWIDDLLDAERKAAAREDRPLTRILLIKALRDASGLGLRDARAAVEDYLRRKGGAGLPDGGSAWRNVVVIVLGLVAVAVFVLSR